MKDFNKEKTPRIKIIQKLYSKVLNPSEKIVYNKNHKDDINLKRTDKLLKIIIYAACFELLYKHKNPKKVIISEYLKTSHFFLEKAQIKYLNAILDKLSDLIRKN